LLIRLLQALGDEADRGRLTRAHDPFDDYQPVLDRVILVHC
jgi:hypothetical protein